MVWVDRALIERALSALEKSQTTAGHLAQRVESEHRGYCSWRSESPACIAHRMLIVELRAALERPRMRRPHAS